MFLNHNQGLTRPIRIHLLASSAAIVLLMGWGFWLDRYHLMNASSGVVYGIGYTDAHARLLGLNLMAIASLILALILLLSAIRWRPKLLMIAASLSIIGWLTLIGLYPWFIQQFVVRPQ
ncbi:MAG: COG1615 family transporter [Acaryochloridaceae cyanobacterium RL_2_7]|nr:COG1615 family transporter [Acaryochloridaceae cyanobacterium RL_2_7]